MVCKANLWREFSRLPHAAYAAAVPHAHAHPHQYPPSHHSDTDRDIVTTRMTTTTTSTLTYHDIKRTAHGYQDTKAALLSTPTFRGWLRGDPDLEGFCMD